MDVQIFTRFARWRKGPRLGNMQRRLKPRPGGRCMSWKIRWRSKSLLMICRRDEVMMSNISFDGQRPKKRNKGCLFAINSMSSLAETSFCTYMESKNLSSLWKHSSWAADYLKLLNYVFLTLF